MYSEYASFLPWQIHYFAVQHRMAYFAFNELIINTFAEAFLTNTPTKKGMQSNSQVIQDSKQRSWYSYESINFHIKQPIDKGQQ